MAQKVITAALFPYMWTMDKIYGFMSGTEEEETYCQTLEGIISHQQQTIKELTANQERQTSKCKKFSDQVIYLSQELHREKNEQQQLVRLVHRQRQMAYEQNQQRAQLETQLEETQRQMMESQNELENLILSYNELHQTYSHSYNSYETDLNAEKQISAALSQQLETQIKSHADTVSEYKEQIENMTFEQNAIRQKAEQEIKLLQQEASEREKSLSKEVEDLKIQLHERTTKNLELVAQLKPEEEVSQVVRTEAVQIMDELKDQLCQQEESPTVSHDHGLVVEDEVCEEMAAENIEGLWNITRHLLCLWQKKKT